MKQACLEGKQSEQRHTEKQKGDRQRDGRSGGRKRHMKNFYKDEDGLWSKKTSHNNAVCAFCGWGALAWPFSLAGILTRCRSGVSEEQADMHDKLILVASLKMRSKLNCMWTAAQTNAQINDINQHPLALKWSKDWCTVWKWKENIWKESALTFDIKAKCSTE